MREYPWYSPYQFAGNNPIWAIDLDGAEPLKKTNELPKEKPVFKTENIKKAIEMLQRTENAIHFTISSLDLRGVDITNPDVQARIYKTVKDHTIIIPQEGVTYVLPKTEETVRLTEALRKNAPAILDKSDFALEAFNVFKPGKIDSKVLKGVNIASKAANPVNILKVHPVANVLITALEPSKLGKGDTPANLAEVKTKTELNKLFSRESKGLLEMDALLEQTLIQSSDGTNLENREGRTPRFED